MATYESYKDSGVKWLGQIPSHWEVKRYKHVFTVRSKRGNPTLPQLCSTQKHGVIPQSLYENRVVTALKGLDQLKQVEIGDFVISLRSFQGGIEYAHYQGIISPAYTILCPNDSSNAGYFRYLLKCPSTLSLLSSMVTGIRQGQNIDYNKLKYEFLPIPPANEQEAIVAYLDKVTGEIDSAIEAQQKMIDTLNERKQIIITRAVTRGLNPDAPLRDSGIDWLSQIPANWMMRKLKWLIASPLQYGANESPDDYSETLPRYIRITDISINGTLKKVGAVSLAWYKASKYMLTKGDVLFARSGATVGKTYLYAEDFASCFAGYLIKAECNDLILPEFLVFFTQSSVYENWKNYIFNKATIQNIGADKYSTLMVPLPSIEEQKGILERLKDDISPINQSIDHCERMISLLQERKQIIINEVVTGEKKVI